MSVRETLTLLAIDSGHPIIFVTTLDDTVNKGYGLMPGTVHYIAIAIKYAIIPTRYTDTPMEQKD